MMKNKMMKAAVFMGPGKIELQEKPVPMLENGEILIKVEYCGICGTDLSIYRGEHSRAQAPLIMGHEFVGSVADIRGDIEKDLKIGDKVTANPLLWCGKCDPCKQGSNHVCENLGLVGIDINGGFAEYVKVSSDKVHKVTGDSDWLEIALTEPLAVGIHAVRKSNLKMGDNVIVVGAGTIGMIVALSSLFSGAGNVWISDVNQSRLDESRSYGLTSIYLGSQDPEQILLKDIGKRADIVFECSGNKNAYPGLTRLSANCGEIVFVGIPHEKVSIDVHDLIFREIKTKSVRVYRDEEFGIAVKLLSARKMELMDLATTILPLDQLKKGLEIASDREGWKVLIKPVS
jgi:2-desacetyl-2-hydroxyethyl bacteriochlorophyllide A dehydrogenase